jgi:hypothetical protein
MTNNQLKNELEIIIKNSENSIEKAVAEEALDAENIQKFFSHLLEYGCVSGSVQSLIYYVDTHSFFDTHYNQIQKILEEYQENHGEFYSLKGDLKNSLAWFSFEYTAYELASRLDLI